MTKLEQELLEAMGSARSRVEAVNARIREMNEISEAELKNLEQLVKETGDKPVRRQQRKRA